MKQRGLLHRLRLRVELRNDIRRINLEQSTVPANIVFDETRPLETTMMATETELEELATVIAERRARGLVGERRDGPRFPSRLIYPSAQADSTTADAGAVEDLRPRATRTGEEVDLPTAPITFSSFFSSRSTTSSPPVRV